MSYVLSALAFLGGLSGLASLRARWEVPGSGRVSTATFLILFAGFVGAGVCTVLAAMAAAWTLPMTITLSRTCGLIVGMGGIALIVASRMHFTFRRAWGLDFDKLVTQGVYRYSRNPQVVGWFLLYAGIAMYGRSGAALLIAGMFLLTFVPWILAEERALERRFGDEYRRYREQTRRFF